MANISTVLNSEFELLAARLSRARAEQQMQAAAPPMPQYFVTVGGGGGGMGGSGGAGWSQIMGVEPIGGLNHHGQVKSFRKDFKEHSKEDFRKISNEPIVKDIMSGMVKLGIEETKERIKEHLLRT